MNCNLRKKEEAFSKEQLNLIKARNKAFGCENTIRAIDEIRTILMNISCTVSRIEGKIPEIDLAGLTKDKLIQTKDVKDITKAIEDLLSQNESMSFTELLDAIGTTSPTLSKYLEKMVQEGKIERIETDKKVLYRLRSSGGDSG